MPFQWIKPVIYWSIHNDTWNHVYKMHMKYKPGIHYFIMQLRKWFTRLARGTNLNPVLEGRATLCWVPSPSKKKKFHKQCMLLDWLKDYILQLPQKVNTVFFNDHHQRTLSKVLNFSHIKMFMCTIWF